MFKDLLFLPLGVEEPILHTVSANSKLFNVALQLKRITLLGASINSTNSEYRQFNINNQNLELLLTSKTKNNKLNQLFSKLLKAVKANTEDDTIELNQYNLKNITRNAIHYALVYYLMLRYYNFDEEYYLSLNEFRVIPTITNIFDKIFKTHNIMLSNTDTKLICEFLLNFESFRYSIGTKVVCLMRNQIHNTTDLSQTIWKALYINKIIKNIPVAQRGTLFSPLLDWGILKCPARKVLTNANLVSKVAFGETIDYIRTSAQKQSELSSKLVSGNLQLLEIENIKTLSNNLRDATININYAYGDIMAVLFYANMGQTFLTEFNKTIEMLRESPKIPNTFIFSILTNINKYKQLIFKYLQGVLLLSKQGIIHNDMHLNNILITKKESDDLEKIQHILESGGILELGVSNIDLTIIDFDKSILFHHHTNNFDANARVINEEIGIVFNTVKSNIVDDYEQVFNCYVMYDILKFGLMTKRIIGELEQELEAKHLTKTKLFKEQMDLTESLIKLSTDTLFKIYDADANFSFKKSNLHGSVDWLISTLFKKDVRVHRNKSSIKESFENIIINNSATGSDGPHFISSKKKYADLLKQNFIAQYASEHTT